METLSTRVSRLISGSFNALVTSMEDSNPELVMSESVREVDKAIEEVRSLLGKTIISKHQAVSRLDREKQLHKNYDEEIAIAITEKRDDLAEAAIGKQLDIEAQLPILENTIAELGKQEKEYESYISALHGKKREIQHDLDIFKRTQHENGSPLLGEITYKRFLPDQPDPKLTELTDLARNNRIQERLEQLKQ